MPRSQALPALASMLLLAGCVPKIESNSGSYELSSFRGPSTMPAGPDGTRQDVQLAGYWWVRRTTHLRGNPEIAHLVEPDLFVEIAGNAVRTVAGVPPDQLLPVQSEWRLNQQDADGVALGFGWEHGEGELRFLHYAFVMGAVTENRAKAIEAFHFEDAASGRIGWAIWEVELERVLPPTSILPAPPDSWQHLPWR